jgi:hypothetical protein
MRGCVGAERRCFIPIIDSLLSSPKTLLPRSLEPIVRQPPTHVDAPRRAYHDRAAERDCSAHFKQTGDARNGVKAGEEPQYAQRSGLKSA